MAARASPMAAQALALGRDDPIARQALADPEVRRCYFSADLNATPVRAALPAHRGHRWQLLRHNGTLSTSCGAVPSMRDLSAPLFMAAESPRAIAAEGAPYGMRMGGKSESAMLQKIRQYQRNASMPLVCHYPTCAVVGSSGSLRGAKFGAGIDAHAAVFRINAAPTRGHERAVGARTTLRVHNSEKPFMLASLGVPELNLVICHMGWIGSCQHQAFSGRYPDRLAQINPVFYGQVWSLLGRPADKRSPSTGLLAIALALGMCGSVSIYGFGKAGRQSKGTCRHYWSCVHFEDEAAYYDPLHTFHDWLAEEQLRTFWLSAGVIVDGGSAYGTGPEATARVEAAAGLQHDRSDAATRWAALKPEWRRVLDTLGAARRSRMRHQRPGKGDFTATTQEILEQFSRAGNSSRTAPRRSSAPRGSAPPSPLTGVQMHRDAGLGMASNERRPPALRARPASRSLPRPRAIPHQMRRSSMAAMARASVAETERRGPPTSASMWEAAAAER